MTLSVREANRQLEQQQRVQRIQSARQHGMALGVAAARNYQSGKADQRRFVAVELKKNWEQERGLVAAQRGALVTYAQHEAGEAHRTADRVMSERTARAAAEQQAWEAERRLGQMRAAVGHRTEQAEREMQEQWQREVHAHRARTRAEEIRRSQEMVRQRRAADASLAAAAAGSGGGLMGVDVPLVPRSAAQMAQDATRPKVQYHHKDGAKVAVTFAVPPELAADPEHEPPGDVAERKRAENKERKRVAAAKTKQAQQAAQHNAALRAAIEREEQNRKQRERQNIKYVMEAAAKQQNLAASTARGVTGANARDFQAEEARRSEMLNRKAHVEFEQTFLQLQQQAQQQAQSDTESLRTASRAGSAAQNQQQQQLFAQTAAAATADALARRRLLRDATIAFDPQADALRDVDGGGAAEWWVAGAAIGANAMVTSGGGVILGSGGGPAARKPGGAPVAILRPRQLVTDTIQTSVLPEPAGGVSRGSATVASSDNVSARD